MVNFYLISCTGNFVYLRMSFEKPIEERYKDLHSRYLEAMKNVDKAKILVEEVKKENEELKERLSRINEISNRKDSFKGNR